MSKVGFYNLKLSLIKSTRIKARITSEINIDNHAHIFINFSVFANKNHESSY